MNRTPEEIKKALECCTAKRGCVNCPYDCVEVVDEIQFCSSVMEKDALEYIRKLEETVSRYHYEAACAKRELGVMKRKYEGEA